ncbi:heat shock protein 70 family [Hyaloraphidium curvatum]|nr:heat shock protein 70 family [Hyaloraphidium curvatum]
MSVVGVDFGNLNCVIAVARNRGIDVIANEASNRLTPSMVSFGPKRRFLGEAAKTLEISNFKNTIGVIKRLAGRLYSDPDIEKYEAKYLNCQLVEGEGGEVAARVMYLNEPKDFTFTQLTAAFLTKVKQITASETGTSNVSDTVMSVPVWFGDRQRRAILDACEISGLNCLRVLNDTTAVALGYGITRTDLPDPQAADAKPRHVLFVDFGHASFQVALVAFFKGQLKVKAVAYDVHLGGRDFDEALTQYCIDEFEKKYKGLNIRENKRAVYRLRQAAEKAKKVLSANPSTVLAVESITEDRDVSMKVERTEFDELTAPLIDRIMGPIEQVLADAGMKPSEVDKVELSGGSSRVLSVKTRIATFFGEDANFDPTQSRIGLGLNADEAVARGNALMCAILSPVFKVRDFAVTDWNTYPVQIEWDPTLTTVEEPGVMEAFGVGNVVPSTKQLTFSRKLPAQIPAEGVTLPLTLSYTPAAYKNRHLPQGVDAHIGKWTIQGIKPRDGSEEVGKAVIKVKARLSPDGVYRVEDAVLVEEIAPAEKPAEAAPAPEAAPMDTTPDGAAADAAPAEGAAAPEAQANGEVPKKDEPAKKKVRKHELSVVPHTPSLPKHLLHTHRELESSMIQSDKLIVDTEYAKNSLEEYVYDARGKLEDRWADFVVADVKDKFMKALNDNEEWLYSEEGEDASKSQYKERLDQLKAIGDPIAHRHRESEILPKAVAKLRESISAYLGQLNAGDDKLSHIPADDLTRCREEAERKQKWLEEKLAKQQGKAKTDDPVVTAAEVDREREVLTSYVLPILSKPKPAPKPATPKPEAKEEKKEGEGGAAPEGEGEKKPEGEAEGGEKKDEMDID